MKMFKSVLYSFLLLASSLIAQEFPEILELKSGDKKFKQKFFSGKYLGNVSPYEIEIFEQKRVVLKVSDKILQAHLASDYIKFVSSFPTRSGDFLMVTYFSAGNSASTRVINLVNLKNTNEWYKLVVGYFFESIGAEKRVVDFAYKEDPKIQNLPQDLRDDFFRVIKVLTNEELKGGKLNRPTKATEEKSRNIIWPWIVAILAIVGFSLVFLLRKKK